MEVDHVSLTPEILVEHAMLHMQIRGCRCAVMNLPANQVRKLALLLMSGAKPRAAVAMTRTAAEDGSAVELTESQVKWFGARFRKAAEHVRRAMLQAVAAGASAAPMQLSTTIQAVGETRRVRLARQRAACVEQFRRARGAPGAAWLDRTVRELRQMFPALRISRTTLYRWERLYQDATTDLPKLLDTRGGDQRTGVARMLRRRAGADNIRRECLRAGSGRARSAEVSRGPRPN